LVDVAKWLDISLSDFDWHLSDMEGGWAGLSDPTWIAGPDLEAKLRERTYQFEWAVVSAFAKHSTPRLDGTPFADGNPEFWIDSPTKQMVDSIFEIVCWDGSATLFIGLPDLLGARLVKNAPGIKNLDEENRKRLTQFKLH
jgi:hypothetical protein